MKHIFTYITQLIRYIATPEYDVPVLCSIEIQQHDHKQYFTDERQRAHTGYKHSNVVWRESIGEPS